MSLHFNSSNCKPYENGRQPTKDELDAREALVFASMATGINHITEATAAEFYARIRLAENVGGPARRIVLPDGKGTEGKYITPAEVKTWIGLTTNASPLTRARFLQRFKFDLDDGLKLYKDETK